jgi:hypothetical protein
MRSGAAAAPEQVKSLASEQQQKADPEVEFRTARVLAQARGGGVPGLAVLLRLLLDLELPDGAAVAALLRLLHACVQVHACRQVLLAQGAVARLLHHANQQLKALLGPPAGPGAGPRAAAAGPGWAAAAASRTAAAFLALPALLPWCLHSAEMQCCLPAPARSLEWNLMTGASVLPSFW